MRWEVALTLIIQSAGRTDSADGHSGASNLPLTLSVRAPRNGGAVLLDKGCVDSSSGNLRVGLLRNQRKEVALTNNLPAAGERRSSLHNRTAGLHGTHGQQLARRSVATSAKV